MENIVDKAAAADLISAVLVGGPVTLPEESRTQQVSPFAKKIKVLYYGGYEHFERLPPIQMDEMSQVIVFHWTMRTEVAE